jgi:hypothetical protein
MAGAVETVVEAGETVVVAVAAAPIEQHWLVRFAAGWLAR